VQVAEGIEGMIHVSDLSAEKRINHPQDVLKVGQSVKAQVLELDTEKRRLKLGIKQLAPTSIDEYVAEHREGDVVSGRVMQVSGDSAQVELGEGIQATCRIPISGATQAASPGAPSAGQKTDLASMTSRLQACWKSGATAEASKPQELKAGQVRSFRITKIEAPTKKVEIDLA
jgi:small subunit ribosomal protein S1